MTSSLVGSHCFIEIHPLSLKGQYSPHCGIMTITQRPKTIHWNTPHLTKVQLLTPVPSPFVNNPLPHFLCSRLGLKHTSPCDWKHNSFTKRILNIFCMQFLLSGNHKALMPNCSSILFPASGCWQDPEAVGLVVLGSLGLHHAAVCSADGLPNLFLFISSAREFVLFYPLKGKALDKVSHETDMATLLLSKNAYRPHSCLASYII